MAASEDFHPLMPSDSSSVETSSAEGTAPSFETLSLSSTTTATNERPPSPSPPPDKTPVPAPRTPPSRPPRSVRSRRNEHRNIVECVLCLQVRRDNVIYMCPNGHNICEQCLHQIKKRHCPQTDCKSQYDDPPRRNGTAEALVRTSTFYFACRHNCGEISNLEELIEHERCCVERTVKCAKCCELLKASDVTSHDEWQHQKCRYHQRGCCHAARADIIHEHEGVCNLRDINCPTLNCGDKVMIRQMMTHIRGSHPTAQFQNRPTGFFSTSWSIRQVNQRQMNTNWAPFVLQFYRDTYFLNLSKDGNDYVAYVTMLADQKATEKRLAKIKIKTPFMSHGVRGKVLSVDDSTEAILSRSKGVAVLRLKSDQVEEVLEKTTKEYLLHMTVHLESPSLGEIFKQPSVKAETAMDRLFGSFVKKA